MPTLDVYDGIAFCSCPMDHKCIRAGWSSSGQKVVMPGLSLLCAVHGLSLLLCLIDWHGRCRFLSCNLSPLPTWHIKNLCAAKQNAPFTVPIGCPQMIYTNVTFLPVSELTYITAKLYETSHTFLLHSANIDLVIKHGCFAFQVLPCLWNNMMKWL